MVVVPFLLLLQNPAVSGDCFPIRFPGIFLQPFLKAHVKRKTFSNLLFKNARCFSVHLKSGSISVSSLITSTVAVAFLPV